MYIVPGHVFDIIAQPRPLNALLWVDHAPSGGGGAYATATAGASIARRRVGAGADVVVEERAVQLVGDEGC